MKMTISAQGLLKYLIIPLALIFITPVRILNGGQVSNAFAGKDVLCIIDLANDMYNPYGLEVGLHYELLNRFADDNHCNIEFITTNGRRSSIDSSLYCKADIIITHKIDSLRHDKVSTLKRIEGYPIWAMNNCTFHEVNRFNRWISFMEISGMLKNAHKRYMGTFNPHKRVEKGLSGGSICPYDNFLKTHSAKLGWDWKIVAAIIYQESGFSISSKSFRGAQGLMQIMPQTGASYGIDNLLDPEQNIIAGTEHLKRLQNLLTKYDIAEDELIKFTLAAYNAGEGRITDCMNFAASKGYDNRIWNEVVKAIPLMREDAILEDPSVRYGKFQGYETIRYVENVLSHYQAIRTILP